MGAGGKAIATAGSRATHRSGDPDMNHGFQLDPHDVLDLDSGASLEEIRDAYREKSKKHHPDLGGDEWAFRVVARAYEILRTTAPPPRPRVPDTGQIRPGVRDPLADPTRLVDVEMLWLRFEAGDLLELLAREPEDNSLSGCLNLTWPGELADPIALPAAVREEVLAALSEAFDVTVAKSRAVSARSRVEGGRFVGWLSYPNGGRAWSAFQVLREALRERGLGVRQWTRDLVMPRERG